MGALKDGQESARWWRWVGKSSRQEDTCKGRGVESGRD